MTEGKIRFPSIRFSQIPHINPHWRKIVGTETEFGVYTDEKRMGDGEARGIVHKKLMPLEPGFIPNGGRIYLDCGHFVEYATPETSNPLEAMIYEKAGEILCKPLSPKLYKNNIDWWGHTFSAHENYLVKNGLEKVMLILPFLVTRQIFAGLGNLNLDGTFELSQRSAHIVGLEGDNTMQRRSIIDKRGESEPLTEVNGWKRLHLILGDANMCQHALFLKLGTTSLVLDLLEKGLIPDLNYNTERAVYDLQGISNSPNWILSGLSGKLRATDVQRKFYDAAKAAFYDERDEVTNEVIERWGRTLEDIDDNSMNNFGRLDWFTVRHLIETMMESDGLRPNNPQHNEILRNITLSYCDIDRETSLFYDLERAGDIERLVPDQLIREATAFPPKDTRANARSQILQMATKLPLESEYYVYLGNAGTTDWTNITIVKGDQIVSEISMPDPSSANEESVARVRHVLGM